MDLSDPKWWADRSIPGKKLVGLEGLKPLGIPVRYVVIEETGQVIDLTKAKPRTNPLLKKGRRN